MAMFSTLIDGFVGENCTSDQLKDCNDEYAVLRVAVDRNKHQDSNFSGVNASPNSCEVLAVNALADECSLLKKGQGVLVEADVASYKYEKKNGKNEYLVKYIAKKVLKSE